MFENRTYETILNRMLSRVKAQCGQIDTREGSIVYDALAPAAVELQNLYIELDWMLDQSFADTQDREYLICRCRERGIVPKKASRAVLKGEFNQDIPLGSRFSLDLLNYTAVKRLGEGIYQMECETEGEAGNQSFGTLLPIDYIRGLTKAELTELLIPGEEEEETEHLRQRYFNSLTSQAFGGNIADYKEKVNGIRGVGGVKVFPVWNGGGTVKLVIITPQHRSPTEELLKQVKEYIDPEEHTGEGYGLAPVGHQVTVEGAEEVKVDVETRLLFQNGWSLERCLPDILSAIDGYLQELNGHWEDSETTIVRVSQIESRILDTEGILDVSDTRLCGGSGNYPLPSNAIAVRGEFYAQES